MVTSSDKVLIAATISMAKALGLKVVAEGVETQEQLDFLSELDCDYAQGYYMSQPLTSESILKYLQSLS